MDDGTRKYTWEIKFETDGRKPYIRNYTCVDGPAKENYAGINTGSIQEMVKRMKEASLTNKYSLRGKKYFQNQICGGVHTRDFWPYTSSVRKKNRTCIIYPHLHTVVSVYMK